MTFSLCPWLPRESGRHNSGGPPTQGPHHPVDDGPLKGPCPHPPPPKAHATAKLLLLFTYRKYKATAPETPPICSNIRAPSYGVSLLQRAPTPLFSAWGTRGPNGGAPNTHRKTHTPGGRTPAKCTISREAKPCKRPAFAQRVLREGGHRRGGGGGPLLRGPPLLSILLRPLASRLVVSGAICLVDMGNLWH